MNKLIEEAALVKMAWGFGKEKSSYDLFHGERVANQLESWVLWADWTMPKNLALLVCKKK